MTNMDIIIMLLPLIILQVTLMVISIVLIIKQKTFKYGNQLMWLLIVLLINMIGPILYFILGRKEQ